MNNKILLLSVAILAIGLFAMPSTLSLFAGQHTFTKGINVGCERCHQDIYDEMSGSKFGTSDAHGAAKLKACQGCHKTGDITGITLNKSQMVDYGGSPSGTYNQNLTNKSAHASVTMQCEGCHTGVPAELMNFNESHGPFYNASRADSSTNGSDMLMGSNEACIGCHTHINVNGTWRRSVGMMLIVNETETGQYNISFAVNKSYNTSYTNNGTIAADGTW